MYTQPSIWLWWLECTNIINKQKCPKNNKWHVAYIAHACIICLHGNGDRNSNNSSNNNTNENNNIISFREDYGAGDSIDKVQ